MFKWLKRPLVKAAYPGAKPLIKYDCRGCMAHDWVEIDRGRIINKVIRNYYDGSARGKKVPCYIVLRDDGTVFDAVVADCHTGKPYMQEHTRNPDEPLEGKIVCLT